MKMLRLNIQLPADLKQKLDAERERGTTAAGLIRHLLDQHFELHKAPIKGPHKGPIGQKGRA